MSTCFLKDRGALLLPIALPKLLVPGLLLPRRLRTGLNCVVIYSFRILCCAGVRALNVIRLFTWVFLPFRMRFVINAHEKIRICIFNWNGIKCGVRAVSVFRFLFSSLFGSREGAEFISPLVLERALAGISNSLISQLTYISISAPLWARNFAATKHRACVHCRGLLFSALLIESENESKSRRSGVAFGFLIANCSFKYVCAHF